LARLYADENFLQPAVEELRRLGHDVLTTADAGMARKAISNGPARLLESHLIAQNHQRTTGVNFARTGWRDPIR